MTCFDTHLPITVRGRWWTAKWLCDEHKLVAKWLHLTYITTSSYIFVWLQLVYSIVHVYTCEIPMLVNRVWSVCLLFGWCGLNLLSHLKRMQPDHLLFASIDIYRCIEIPMLVNRCGQYVSFWMVRVQYPKWPNKNAIRSTVLVFYPVIRRCIVHFMS